MKGIVFSLIILIVFLLNVLSLKSKRSFMVESVNKDISISEKLFTHFQKYGNDKENEIHDMRKEIRENGVRGLNNLADLLEKNDSEKIKTEIEGLRNLGKK